MNLNKYLKNKHLLLLMSSLFISLIIWNRLFRQRMPKELPYMLSDISFILLLITCLIFFLSIVFLIASKFNLFTIKQSPFELYLQESLYYLDFLIKNVLGKYFSGVSEYLFIMFLIYGEKTLLYSKYIYFGFMLPKLLLPLILLFDIFYFHKIKFFYIFLIMLIIPLLYRYLYYSLTLYNDTKIDDINRVLDFYIEEEHYGVLTSEKLVENPARFFIQEKVLKELKVLKIIHEFSFEIKEEVLNTQLKNTTKDEQITFFNAYWKRTLPLVHRYYRLLYLYNLHKGALDYNLTLFTVIIYFCCWTYILLNANYSGISYNLLNFLIMWSGYGYKDPFSET